MSAINLNIHVNIGSIKNAKDGHLISYGDGTKFGFLLKRTENNNIALLSLSEKKPMLCLDDFGSELHAFESICDYGKDCLFIVNHPCRLVSHLSDVTAGCLIVKGDQEYLAVNDRGQAGKAQRGISFSEGKSIHADSIGFGIGCFEEWGIGVGSLATPNQCLELARFSAAKSS